MQERCSPLRSRLCPPHQIHHPGRHSRTLDDLKSLLTQAVSQMGTLMRHSLTQLAHPRQQQLPTTAQTLTATANGCGEVCVCRRVPEGWRLPPTGVMSTWRMWHCGIPADRIAPLRRQEEPDLYEDSAQITQLSRMRNVKGEITEQLISMGVIVSGARKE
jgi:hypothetical protein